MQSTHLKNVPIILQAFANYDNYFCWNYDKTFEVLECTFLLVCTFTEYLKMLLLKTFCLYVTFFKSNLNGFYFPRDFFTFFLLNI